MALVALEIKHFRNLAAIELEPAKTGFNLIHGQNGSGKTSLLEAIYFLGIGRSFRSSLLERIINHEAESFSIFARIMGENEQFVPIGIERNKDKTSKIRLDGKDQSSIAELTRLMPIRLINAQNYSLLDGGPVFRRKYLDWGIFYLRADFLALWQKLERALKQRNAALRNRLSKNEVSIWTRELIEAAQPFHQARKEYVQQLAPLLLDLLPKLLKMDIEIGLEYLQGWSWQADYEAILEQAYFRDLGLGYTQFGPHKADLKVLINQVPAKDFLSRGQQKLFVCAMILAQGILLQKLVNKQPIYLIDDLPSELDSTSLERIIALLAQQQTQVFMTAIDPNEITNVVNKAITTEQFSEMGQVGVKIPITMFHVEQGKVKPDSLRHLA